MGRASSVKISLSDGSGTADLKYLFRDVDRHGNVRIFFRRRVDGRLRKTRVREEPGTPEFMARYRELFEGRETTHPARQHQSPPGSLAWLVDRYQASAEFLGLGDSTRRRRSGILNRICARRTISGGTYGEKPYAAMEPRHVAQIRDEIADRPEAANDRVKSLRQVFKWAKLPHIDLAKNNPAMDVPYFRTGSTGHHTWTVEEVRQYEAHHPIGSPARLALALLMYTGVRRSDLVQLGPKMEQDGGVVLRGSQRPEQKAKTQGDSDPA